MKIQPKYPVSAGHGELQSCSEFQDNTAMPQNKIEDSAADKAALFLQEKLDRLLAKAKPSKRDLTQQNFRNLYPKLEEHITKGKPLKDILVAFNLLTQANVCLRTFKEMLANERSLRNDRGDPVSCHACTQPLRLIFEDGSSAKIPGRSETYSMSSNTTELE